MNRFRFFGTVAAVLLMGGLLAASAGSVSGASTLFVDDDGAECPGAYTTIQAAVNAAAPGDTVHVCNGRYRESVVIGKTLVLEGDVDTVVTTPGPVTSNLNIITVQNATNVEIRNLVVGFPYDLSAFAPAGGPDLSVEANAPRDPGIQFRGIVYQNATGSIHDVNVARIRGAMDANGVPDPDMATQDSRSILVTGGSNVSIHNLVTTEYGNVGITVQGSGTFADIRNTQIEGFGNLFLESTLVVQRGIEVKNGASATILGNGLENNWYTGTAPQPKPAADIALENAVNTRVGGGFTMGEINLIAEAQVGLYRCGGSGITIGFNFFVLNGQDQVTQPAC